MHPHPAPRLWTLTHFIDSTLFCSVHTWPLKYPLFAKHCLFYFYLPNSLMSNLRVAVVVVEYTFREWGTTWNKKMSSHHFLRSQPTFYVWRRLLFKWPCVHSSVNFPLCPLFKCTINLEEPTDLFLVSVFIEASPPSFAKSVFFSHQSFHRHQCCLFFSYFPSRHFE